MDRDNSQIKAIKAPVNDSSLIVAPPGYGKTYVMARRIEHLLNTGALKPPKRLLGLTYTNAAAAEMRKSVSNNIAHKKLETVDLGTIHSFCYQVLCAYGSYISISKDFAILSENETKEICGKFAEQIGLNFAANREKLYKENYRNWIVERLLKHNIHFFDDTYNSEFENIYQQYIGYCTAQNKLDFDHILTHTYQLFLEEPNVLEMYRATYSHILIDEFQDTNPLQFKIVALLVEGNLQFKNEIEPLPIFFFGDEDQAIYEFMGATRENVNTGALRFNCKTYTLEKNHRTDSPKILEISSALRSDIPTLPSSIPVDIHVNQSQEVEAQAIQAEIEGLSLPLHQICIVAPNKYRLFTIREALSKSESTPFVFIPEFSGARIEENFTEIFNRLRAIQKTQKGTLRKEIQSETNITTEQGNKDVVDLMLNMASNYDIRFANKSLHERANNFLNHILLEVNWGHLVKQNVKEKIFLSTIHGVKGLEFNHVIICGLEKGSLPNWSTCYPCRSGSYRTSHTESISEAERVFYVGVTRSIQEISLYSVQSNRNNTSTPISCLIHSLQNHIQADVDLTQHICGYDSL